MTPQQLIDLPGYGSAEKKLRELGKWRLSPEEKFDKSIGRIMGSIEDAMSAISDAESDLDSALSTMSKAQRPFGGPPMKLTIDQSTLSALLSRVSKAVETRTTLPILSNVLLSADGDTLTATATDLDVEVSTTAQAAVERKGSTTVSAATLGAIVAKLSKGKLVTLESDGLNLRITSGRSDLSLAALPIEDFPRVASSDYQATFQADQTALKRMFDLSAFAMSTEETRYYLQGVYLHSVDGNARAVATDGHRLAKVDSDLDAEFPSVIVPRKTVGLLKSLLDEGDATVSVSETKIRVDVGHSVITSKVIDGIFPDYSRIIPTTHKTEVTVSATDVKHAAALVSLVSGERVRAVKIGVAEDLLTLTVIGYGGTGVEEVDAVMSGDEVECGVNSKYLAEILQACNGDKAVMQFQSSGDPIVIRPSEDDKALFLVMPMRV